MKKKYGVLMSNYKCNIIALEWNFKKIPHPKNLDEAKTEMMKNNSGVYVFEGCHDSRPEGGILYIGQSKEIVSRLDKSSLRIIWRENGELGFFADVWDITLRWAVIEEKSVKAVESVLIRAHAPSFNSKEIRNVIPSDNEAKNLIIFNDGVKGRLLPIVAGHYFDNEFWKGFG